MMGTGKILVVDDEAALRSLLADMCVMKGFRVDSAKDGAEGLKYVEDARYDLVIVDYEMPVMNGIEFVRRVREKGNPLPIIGVSALEVGDAFMNAGATSFLQKPFRFEEIEQKIWEIIGFGGFED